MFRKIREKQINNIKSGRNRKMYLWVMIINVVSLAIAFMLSLSTRTMGSRYMTLTEQRDERLMENITTTTSLEKQLKAMLGDEKKSLETNTIL